MLIKFEIEGLQVETHQRDFVIPLSKTSYPLHSTGSTQVDSTYSQMNKIADWEENHQLKQ